jgi:hypothetical protein
MSRSRTKQNTNVLSDEDYQKMSAETDADKKIAEAAVALAERFGNALYYTLKAVAGAHIPDTDNSGDVRRHDNAMHQWRQFGKELVVFVNLTG